MVDVGMLAGKYAGIGCMAAGAAGMAVGVTSGMPGNPVTAAGVQGGTAAAAGATLFAVGAGVEMLGGLFARAFLSKD